MSNEHDADDVVGELLNRLSSVPEWAWVRRQIEADQTGHEEWERHLAENAEAAEQHAMRSAMGSPQEYQSVSDYYDQHPPDVEAEQMLVDDYHAPRHHHGGPALVREHDGRLRSPLMRYPAAKDSGPIKHSRGGESYYDAEPTKRYDTRDLHSQQLGEHETGVDEGEGSTHYSKNSFYEPEDFWDEAGGGRESAGYVHVEGESARPASPRGQEPQDYVAVARYQRESAEEATARALKDPSGRTYESHLRQVQEEMSRSPRRLLPAPTRKGKRRYCKSSSMPGIRSQHVPALSGSLSSYADATAIASVAAKAGVSFEHALSVLAGQ
jgi:hypothetical protein